MKALALDQAPSATGWAFSADDEKARVVWGTIVGSDYGDDDQRMMKDFANDFRALLSRFKPDIVFFEQIYINPKRINLPITYAQFAISSAVQFVAMEQNVPAEMVLINEWRKHFLGRANRPKDAPKLKTEREYLKEAAKQECLRRNMLVANDHEAEAIGILDYGLSCHSVEYRFRTKADRERRRLKQAREAMER